MTIHLRIKKQRGFTLLELLIAMLVFAIMSVMAYAGLQSIIDNKEHTQKVAKQLVSLQTAFMFIGRDINQAIGRSVRDGYGDVQPAMQGGEFGRELMSFTRAGYTNFLKSTRSNLQRVAYRFDEGVLKRVTWPMLDQNFTDEAYERDLLTDVEKIEITYVGQKGESQTQWPPSFDVEEEVVDIILPRAVIVTIETKSLGNVRRVFAVSPGEYVMKNGLPRS